MTCLVQDDARSTLPQAELARPIHELVAGCAYGHPGHCSDRIPRHESGNRQGETPGRQGVDQQMAPAFSLLQRRLRRLAGEVSGDVQEQRHRDWVRDVTRYR